MEFILWMYLMQIRVKQKLILVLALLLLVHLQHTLLPVKVLFGMVLPIPKVEITPSIRKVLKEMIP